MLPLSPSVEAVLSIYDWRTLKMKQTQKLTALTLALILLASCSKPWDPYEDPEELGVFYESDNMRVTEVKRLTPEEEGLIGLSMSGSYGLFMEDSLFSGYQDFAVAGKVSNVREMRVDAAGVEKPFRYCTLFDLTVDRVYDITGRDQSVSSGDTITIYSGHSSYNVDKNLTPILQDGDEYLIFVALSSTVMEYEWPYNLIPISQYAVTSPTHRFLRKNGDYYESSLDHAFEVYDPQRISKADAYGIDGSNYITAGLSFGIDFTKYMPEQPDPVWIEERSGKYVVPNKLEGEYDYQKGLLVHEWRWIKHSGFASVPEHVYLYNVEAFEATVQRKIAEYKELGEEAILQRIEDYARKEGLIK
jgi:hypothetical protein